MGLTVGYVNAPVVFVDLACRSRVTNTIRPQSTSLHNDKDERDSTGARWKRQALQTFGVQNGEEDRESQPAESV